MLERNESEAIASMDPYHWCSRANSSSRSRSFQDDIPIAIRL